MPSSPHRYRPPRHESMRAKSGPRRPRGYARGASVQLACVYGAEATAHLSVRILRIPLMTHSSILNGGAQVQWQKDVASSGGFSVVPPAETPGKHIVTEETRPTRQKSVAHLPETSMLSYSEST